MALPPSAAIGSVATSALSEKAVEDPGDKKHAGEPSGGEHRAVGPNPQRQQHQHQDPKDDRDRADHDLDHRQQRLSKRCLGHLSQQLWSGHRRQPCS